MLKIIILADIAPDDVFGFKECVAMYLERFGPSRVVEVQTVQDEQIAIGKEKKK